MSKIVKGFGPLDAKIMVIGESPGRHEVEQGKPFVGESGKFLRQLFLYAGINPDDIRYDNIMETQPPGNDFSAFEKTPELIHQRVEALKQQIRINKPNIVICAGGVPLKYLTGKSPITKWRGFVFWESSMNCKVLGTYHPSSCLRQRRLDKKLMPGQYEYLSRADIAKAVRHSTNHEFHPIKISTLIEPNFSEAETWLKHLLKTSKEISIDIETKGLRMLCISFSFQEGFAASIPFFKTVGDKFQPYWNPEQAQIIFELIKAVLESSTPKIFQNAQFDIAVLKYCYGIETKNMIWDTMIAAHNIYCEFPKDLGSLLSLYTDLPYHKYMAQSGSDREFWQYNALDAHAALAIYHAQIKEMMELGILKHYINVTNPIVQPCIEMQVGVKVDIKTRDSVLGTEKQFQEQLLSAIQDVTWKSFNPSSPQQCSALFYEGLQIRKRYNKGTLTIDKTAIASIQEKKISPFITNLCSALLSYRKSRKMSGVLETPLSPDGRIQTAYNVAGTETGRLASRESIFGTGTNLQNLTKHLRQILIPDEQEEFCHIDQWAAEAYVTALESEETTMLQMLDQGIKIHQWLLDIIIKQFPDESKQADMDYAQAKQFVHALDYNVQPELMARVSGLSLSICSWIYHFYHKTFPGIQRRMERIKEELRTTGTLTSLLGRRRVFFAPWGSMLFNEAFAWPAQSVIGELTNKAMAKIYYWGIQNDPWMFPALNTHDGIVTRFRKEDKQKVKEKIISICNQPISFKGRQVVIPIEIGWGSNFGEVLEKEVVRYEH